MFLYLYYILLFFLYLFMLYKIMLFNYVEHIIIFLISCQNSMGMPRNAIIILSQSYDYTII